MNHLRQILFLLSFVLCAMTATAYKHAELSEPADVTQGGVTFKSSLPEGAVNPKIQFKYGTPYSYGLISEYSDYLQFFDLYLWDGCDESEGGGVKTGNSQTLGLDYPKNIYESLDEDAEISFEWATDNDEGVDSFDFTYSYNGKKVTAASISGYKPWTKVSVILPSGASDITWESNRTSDMVGTGIVKLRNVEMHLSYGYRDDKAKWVDHPDGWSENMRLSKLPYNTKLLARVIAEMPDGETVYSPVRAFTTLDAVCLRPSDASPKGLDFTPSQTAVTVAGNFNTGDVATKKGFYLAGGLSSYESYVAYDLKIDGWNDLSDESAVPATISFNSPTPVKVTLNADLKGWWIYNYVNTGYASATISSPFNAEFTSRSDENVAEAVFPAGTNTFTITPYMGDMNTPREKYSLSLRLSFLAIGDAGESSVRKEAQGQARLQTIYADSDEFRVVIKGLKPKTEYRVYPFIETEGDIFNPEPRFVSIDKWSALGSGSFDMGGGSSSGSTAAETPPTYIFSTLNGIAGEVTAVATQSTIEMKGKVDAGDGVLASAGFRYALAGSDNFVEKKVTASESGDIYCLLERLKPDTEYQIGSWIQLEDCDEKAYSELIDVKTKPIEVKAVVSNVTQTKASVVIDVATGGTALSIAGYELRKEKANNGEQYDSEELTNTGHLETILENLDVNTKYTIVAYANSALNSNVRVYSESVEFTTKDISVGTIKLNSIDSDFNLHVEVPVDLGDAEVESVKVQAKYPYNTISADCEISDGKVSAILRPYGSCFDAKLIVVTLSGNTKEYMVGALTPFPNPVFTSQCLSADFKIEMDVMPANPDKLQFHIDNEDCEVTYEVNGNCINGHIKGLYPDRTYHMYGNAGEITIFQSNEFNTRRPYLYISTYTTETTASFVINSSEFHDLTNDEMDLILQVRYDSGTLFHRVFTHSAGGDYIKVTGLLPNQEYSVYASSAIDGNSYNIILSENKVKTKSIKFPEINAAAYQTAVVVDFDPESVDLGDCEPLEWGYDISWMSSSYPSARVPVTAETGNRIIFTDLLPDCEYSVYPYVLLKKGGEDIYWHCASSGSAYNNNLKTKPIVVKTKGASHISDTSAWLEGYIECDTYSGYKLGFEF